MSSSVSFCKCTIQHVGVCIPGVILLVTRCHRLNIKRETKLIYMFQWVMVQMGRDWWVASMYSGSSFIVGLHTTPINKTLILNIRLAVVLIDGREQCKITQHPINIGKCKHRFRYLLWYHFVIYKNDKTSWRYFPLLDSPTQHQDHYFLPIYLLDKSSLAPLIWLQDIDLDRMGHFTLAAGVI